MEVAVMLEVEAEVMLLRRLESYYWQGSGGGGSSYVISDASVEVIENLQGANNGAGYVLITTAYDETQGKYQPEQVPTKNLTPKEAVSTGFNMLSKNPYAFSNAVKTGDIDLQGILIYNASGELVIVPEPNEELHLRVYYKAPASTYKIVWEWREVGSSGWTEIKTVAAQSLSGLPTVQVKFSPPTKEFIVRVSFYLESATTIESAMAVGFNFNKEAYGSTANLEVKDYDLSHATGMVYWKNRLVVYGVAEAADTIFMSEINEPGYFPYPNNIDIFDEPVVYVLPFLENLIIFTTTKIFLIVLNPDGLTWTKKLIQSNMAIRDEDIAMIQVVKSMIFFKSGNYYYMIVPRLSSMTGDLTVAPISRPMENFFDNFETAVTDIFDKMYNYTGTLELVNYINFLDFEDVHCIYTFSTDSDVYYNFDILYNTVSRSWRSHIYESQFLISPIQAGRY